jgi:nucleotide-binding universal stress UspA family protein
MTYKTILVYLNDPKRAQRLLDVAVPLAKAHGAHLVGLAVMPPYVVIPAYEAAGVSSTVDEHRVAYLGDIGKLKAMFSEAARKEGVATEWREADAGFGTAAIQILEHARSADIVIIAQHDPDWSYSTFLEAADRIVIECGRPVLVVPNSGPLVMPPKRVVIAWNGRREAARAAFDALPLLSPASDVSVIWVDTAADRVASGDVAGADLSTTLARHGFKCEAATVHAPNGDAAAAILREAGARGADLLVMGAYGHSRVREFILGGASRDILSRADRLVLMSH